MLLFAMPSEKEIDKNLKIKIKKKKRERDVCLGLINL